MKKYNPTPFKKGCKDRKIYEREFVDRVGNKAMITYCDFTNSKGVRIEEHILYVKWF